MKIVFDVIDGNRNKSRYEFGPGTYSLGKGDQSDIVLNDPHASRLHAMLTVTAEKVQIEDKNSTNGTWAEGAIIAGPRDVKADDVFQFGQLQLKCVSLQSDLGIYRDRLQRPIPAEILPNLESEDLLDVKRKIQGFILDYLDLRKRPDLQDLTPAQLRVEAQKATRKIIERHIDKIPDDISEDDLVNQVVSEAVGLGALEPFLDDDAVTEIMVNGPNIIYVERNGKIELSGSRFTSTTSLMGVIDRIVSPLGRRIDESSPMVDARLPDGSRVNAIIPPLSLIGPTITIRKFSRERLSVEDLISHGSMSVEMAVFLKECIQHKRNVIVSGGTGTGKTTTLNVLSSFIGENDRIVTIEDAAELQLDQPHIVSLESRPPNAEGKGHVTIRDLFTNALRMRPDRVVVGECRGGEALEMLQAMNTGHDGSLTTGHANTPRDFLSRLEVMVLMAGVDLPVRAIREQIASAVDIVVQQSRLADGTRKVVSIMELTGIENERILLKPIFEFKREGVDDDGRVTGQFRSCGNIPDFYSEMANRGIQLDHSIFNLDKPDSADSELPG